MLRETPLKFPTFWNFQFIRWIKSQIKHSFPYFEKRRFPGFRARAAAYFFLIIKKKAPWAVFEIPAIRVFRIAFAICLWNNEFNQIPHAHFPACGNKKEDFS